MGCSSDYCMTTFENKKLDNEKEHDKKNINENYQIIKMGLEKKNISLDNKTSIKTIINKIEHIKDNSDEEIKVPKIMKLKEKKESIIIGLNNIGATCYMNATLQSFSNTDKLTEYFLNTYKYDPNDEKKIMSNEYYKVIKNLWDINNKQKCYSPYDFKKKLSQENILFAGNFANDSKDLINFLLERIHTELNVINNNNYNEDDFLVNNIDQLDENKVLNKFKKELEVKYNSIISNLFHGILETKSKCLKCECLKYNFQIFSFIEFPLKAINNYFFSKGLRKNFNSNENQNPDVDLYECFEYYNRKDLMTGDNQMYCNICNGENDFEYGSQLYSIPEYLIINFNRGRNAIYECKVNFPEILDLSNYTTIKDKNNKLELYSVICHIGPSSMSGHFVAYCKNRIDKKWYLYNDAFVTLCEYPQDYQNKMPYILFYQAKK